MNSNRLSKKQILLVSLTALIFVVIAVAADMIFVVIGRQPLLGEKAEPGPEDQAQPHHQ